MSNFHHKPLFYYLIILPVMINTGRESEENMNSESCKEVNKPEPDGLCFVFEEQAEAD